MNPQGQYRLLLEHKSEAKPGEYSTVEVKPLIGLRELFRATGAEPVDGVDYSAFKINGVFVGQTMQWYGGIGGEPWPVTDLFEKWDLPMDAAQAFIPITIQFINTSKKPQPFAVMLVGKLAR